MAKKIDDTVEEVRETAIREMRDAFQKLADRKRTEADTLRENANRRRDQDSDLADAVPTPPLRTDSRGRPIPEGVQRLPSGKLPQNFSYAGKVYDGKRWTDDLKAKYPDGVRFTKKGYPDFSPYALKTMKIDPHFEGNHSSDFSKADKDAGISEAYRQDNALTWHHHQDGTTLQLVPRDIHNAVKHAGGVALAKGRS